MPAKKILVVEDDEDTRLALRVRLGSWGYRTAFAGDAILATTTSRTEKPDLIILDLGLPRGDGFLVMEKHRAIPALARIPVIVLSAHNPHRNMRRALDAGAQAYFQKPVDNDALRSSIRKALGATRKPPSD